LGTPPRSVGEFESPPGSLVAFSRRPVSSISRKEMETTVIRGEYELITGYRLTVILRKRKKESRG
jgi:hypothetical protein